MKANLVFAREKFKEFNAGMFGGKLPDIPVLISNARTFIGVLRYEKRRNWFGKTECFNFRMYISTRFDLQQQEVEDTIIHEMIHLYIAYSDIKDSSTHGVRFREMMNHINKEYGRNITISHRGDKDMLETDIHRKPHYICETLWEGGERYITCVTRTKIFEVNRIFERQNDCLRIRWWFSTDSFFNRYPSCRTAKLFRISEKDYKEKVANATECICDEKFFQPLKTVGG